MEGGRYFRTGAYEKEKYFIESISPYMYITITDKCEITVLRFLRKCEENLKFIRNREIGGSYCKKNNTISNQKSEILLLVIRSVSRCL